MKSNKFSFLRGATIHEDDVVRRMRVCTYVVRVSVWLWFALNSVWWNGVCQVLKFSYTA